MATENGPSPKKAKLENGVFSKHSKAVVLDYGSQYTQVRGEFLFWRSCEPQPGPCNHPALITVYS